MKKLLAIGLTLILVTGCSSSKKSTFKDDQILYKIGNKPTRKSDIYNLLVEADQTKTIYQDMIEKINENAEVSTEHDEAIAERVTKEVASLQETFGDSLEQVIQNAGYDSLDTFIEKQLKPAMRFEFEIKDYVVANLDAVIAEYNIRDVSIIATDDKALADSIQASLNEGVAPEDIDLQEKATLTDTITSRSYDSKSKTLNSFTNTKTPVGISKVMFDEDSKIYYNVVVHDTNFSEKIDDVMSTLLQAENYADNYTANQFKEANFKIYDSKMKAMFENVKPGYQK